MTEETKRAREVLDGIDERDFRIAHQIVMDGDRFRAVYDLAEKALHLEESGLVEALEYYANEHNWTCAEFEYVQQKMKPKYKDLFTSTNGPHKAKEALKKYQGDGE